MTLGLQMAEEKAAFEKECDVHRSDLSRIQNKRVQEFDLLTTTAGLDLIHIVQATEPSSPTDAIPAAVCVSKSPAASCLRPQSCELSFPVTSSIRVSSPAKHQLTKTTSKHQQFSSTRVVPQYVPAAPPKTKTSPDRPTPETTRL